jgi:hypothetical protein
MLYVFLLKNFATKAEKIVIAYSIDEISLIGWDSIKCLRPLEKVA